MKRIIIKLSLTLLLFLSATVLGKACPLDMPMAAETEVLFKNIESGSVDAQSLQLSISLLNSIEQKKLMLKISPANKSKIWIEHLNHVLISETLNEFQTTVVKDAIKLASEVDFFDNDTSLWQERYEKRVEALHYLAMEYFDKKQAKYYFSSLSSESNKTNFVEEPDHVTLTSRSNSFDNLGICNCSKRESFCHQTLRCKGHRCLSKGSGCGWFWALPCDGVCLL